MKFRILLLATTAFGSLTLAQNASAATQTTNMTVQAEVVAACTVSANTLDFGAISSTGSANNASAAVTVNCTNGSASVSVDLVPGSSSVNGTGTLTNGTHTLTYALYQNSARSTAWGSTTNTRTTDDSSAAIGTGSPQTLTVYGQIHVQTANLTVGTYSDTVTVTVNF